MGSRIASSPRMFFAGVGPSNAQPRHPKVRAGALHTVALTAAGEVWTWGCNDNGALGRLTDDVLSLIHI
eukprot:12214851-Alexandrium_andersonii.AAC.1